MSKRFSEALSDLLAKATPGPVRTARPDEVGNDETYARMLFCNALGSSLATFEAGDPYIPILQQIGNCELAVFQRNHAEQVLALIRACESEHLSDATLNCAICKALAGMDVNETRG